MAIEIIHELKAISNFLSARAAVNPASPEVCLNMVNGLARKIHMMPVLTTTEAASLYAALKECSNIMGSGHGSILHAAIDSKVSDACSNQPSSTNMATRKPQLLVTPQNYLTASDWKVIEAGDLEERKWMLIKRLQALGVSSLHEQTVKWFVGLLVWSIYKQTNSYPAFKDIHAMVQNFKVAFEANKRKLAFVGLTSYPPHPSGLPKDLFDQAYVDEDKPEAREVLGLEDVASQVPLRLTSKLLREDQRVKQPDSANGVGEVFMNFATALQAFMNPKPAAAKVELFPKSSTPPPLPLGDVVKEDSPSEVKAVATPQAQTWGTRLAAVSNNASPDLKVSSSGGPAPKELPQDRISSEDYEAATLSALLKGRKGKGGSKVLKRPAAAASSSSKAQKRPAAALQGGAILWDDKFHGNRASFTSKHYHEARKQALKRGCSEAEAKARARKAHAEAAALWDAHRE
jgi:hypothetical protein